MGDVLAMLPCSFWGAVGPSLWRQGPPPPPPKILQLREAGGRGTFGFFLQKAFGRLCSGVPGGFPG